MWGFLQLSLPFLFHLLLPTESWEIKIQFLFSCLFMADSRLAAVGSLLLWDSDIRNTSLGWLPVGGMSEVFITLLSHIVGMGLHTAFLINYIHMTYVQISIFLLLQVQ